MVSHELAALQAPIALGKVCSPGTEASDDADGAQKSTSTEALAVLSQANDVRDAREEQSAESVSKDFAAATIEFDDGGGEESQWNVLEEVCVQASVQEERIDLARLVGLAFVANEDASFSARPNDIDHKAKVEEEKRR